ncbi:MAG: hypothetical protein KC442_10080, partial [Thermomicrobiales bacterium]|nr:hypothetical protein [Thermomicrobiales bacterium]
HLSPVAPALRRQEINGEPGVIALIDGAIANAATFEMDGDRITHIYIQVNPDKLEPLAAALHMPIADWSSLLVQREQGTAS